VKKLKENIWRGLDIKIAEAKEPQGEDEDESMVSAHCFFFSSSSELTAEFAGDG
jgi:hypothetical protein